MVEGFGKRADLVIFFADRHAYSQVALADAFRSSGQTADGTHNPAGRPQAEPHGREQDQHCHDNVERGESELDLRAVLVQALIFGDRIMRALLPCQHLWVQGPIHQKIGVDECIQTNQR